MRSAQQALQISLCGEPQLQVNGGGKSTVSAEWMIPKALWLKQMEPEVYAAARYICEYQDFMNFRLTGRMCASVNNASVRWHYSTVNGWPLSLLSAVGLEDLLAKWPSEVVPLGGHVGHLSAAAAQHLGLKEGTLVAQGGADAFVGMLGLGVVSDGQMALLTGSSHLQLGLSAKEIHGPGIFGTYADAVLPGLHVVEGGQTSTGSTVNWLKRLLGDGDDAYRKLNEDAAALPPGAEDLVCLDHFQGSRTPVTDAHSRGVIAGLTLAHGRGHLFRALIEAVAYGTELVLEAMREVGYRPGSVTMAGGITKSELWMQIHADVSNLPFLLTEVSDAPSLGAALLAAVAANLYPDIPTAVQHMVSVDRIVNPSAATHRLYRPHYQRYRRLYPALAPILHDRPSATAAAGGGSAAGWPALDTPSAKLALQQHHAAAAAAAAATASALSAATSAFVSGHHPYHTAHHHHHHRRRSPSPSGNNSNNNAASPSQSSSSHEGAMPPPKRVRHPRPPPLIAPSILSADFANLAGEVSRVVAAGADWIHVDMYDGSLAENFTLGPPVVASLRAACGDVFLDCHLAVSQPAKYVRPLAEAGGSSVTFHLEALDSLGAASELCRLVRKLGMRVGVALAPASGVDAACVLAEEGELDLVLCMTVEPGFGGQRFKPEVLDKVRLLRTRFPHLDIQVDGGITPETAELAAMAGANILVSGTAVFKSDCSVKEAIRQLREPLLGRFGL